MSPYKNISTNIYRKPTASVKAATHRNTVRIPQGKILLKANNLVLYKAGF